MLRLNSKMDSSAPILCHNVLATGDNWPTIHLDPSAKKISKAQPLVFGVFECVKWQNLSREHCHDGLGLRKRHFIKPKIRQDFHQEHRRDVREEVSTQLVNCALRECLQG